MREILCKTGTENLRGGGPNKSGSWGALAVSLTRGAIDIDRGRGTVLGRSLASNAAQLGEVIEVVTGPGFDQGL